MPALNRGSAAPEKQAMHHVEALLTLHALRRLLGGGVLLAVIALALAAFPATAQVQAPPGAHPDQVPGQPFDDEDRGDEGDDHDEPDPSDQSGAAPSLRPPSPGTAPAVGMPNDDGDGWGIPVEDELAPVTSTYVKGRVARLRTDGKAAIPLGAPKRVRRLIAHYNRIAGKRYKWGGGHARLVDSGYDCSGAVGYGLIKGGLLNSTMVSGSFARWGAAGAGRWVTVYAHKDHVYVEVAGLRLDTSAVGDRAASKGVRWRPVIGQRRGFKVRHPVGL